MTWLIPQQFLKVDIRSLPLNHHFKLVFQQESRPQNISKLPLKIDGLKPVTINLSVQFWKEVKVSKQQWFSLAENYIGI